MSVGRLRKTVALKIENLHCITTHTNNVNKKSFTLLAWQCKQWLEDFQTVCRNGFYGLVGQ